MKNKMRTVCIFAFLLSLLFLCTAPIAYAQTGINSQVLSGGSLDLDTYSKTAAENDADKIAALTSLIVMYSEQLEEFDRSSGVFVVACISFCGVLLGLIITLISKKEKIDRPNYALSGVFALLPGIMTLCLYVFSMQCRRVVFFRGYLTYLEKELSNLVGIPMVFNDKVVPKFFGEFATNTSGPYVMCIFILLLFAVTIWLCIYFAKSPPNCQKAIDKKNCAVRVAVHLALILVFATCIYFCRICAIDLMDNAGIPQKVYNFCINGIVSKDALQ